MVVSFHICFSSLSCNSILCSGLSAMYGVNPNQNNDNQKITKLLLLIIMTMNLEFCRTAFRPGLVTQSRYGTMA